MSDEKHIPIHAHIWSPKGFHLFGSSKKDPAKVVVYYCNNSANCELLKKGQCIHGAILGPRCPYGYVGGETGYTQRARNFSKWISDKEKEYAAVLSKVKGGPADKMVVIGEWVYLPYAHLDMNEHIPILGKSNLFISGKPFIKVTDFTVEVIQKIVDFHPHALFGGEITDYQNKHLPLFLFHLKEVFPDLFKQVIELRPEYVERYKIQVRDSIGRKALLSTVSPCKVKLSKDEAFDWDGKTLKGKKDYVLGLSLYDENNRSAVGQIDITITPDPKAVIVITDNDQVNTNTQFVD